MKLNFFQKARMKISRSFLRLLSLALALGSFQVIAIAQDVGFAEEAKDFGVSPTKYPRSRSSGYGSATPTEIPGAKVVTTDNLATMLIGDAKPVLIVVYGETQVVPGAYVMDGAGEDRLLGPDKGKFAQAMAKLTDGDKSKLVAFYCHGPKCWLSYNASLHAMELGYSNVLWYRGGRDAWRAAGKAFSAPAGSW